MNYHLANPKEVIAARSRLTYLVKKQGIVKINEVKKQRSLSQNSYLHLILSAFGAHFGYTLEESKLVYKQINSDIYYYNKKGRQFIRSSADLNKDEMAKTIDKFMIKSAYNGLELPLATDSSAMLRLENYIEKNSRYL